MRPPMVVTVVAARTNRVGPALPVIVSNDLNGYLLSDDGRRPQCHWGLQAGSGAQPRRIILDLRVGPNR